MDETLKQKIEDALRAACAPAPAIIKLEDIGNRVGGQVISVAFEGLRPSERQDRIWTYLDKALTTPEAVGISFIVADTPEETQALAQSRAT